MSSQHEFTRRQFMINAARSYLGVSVVPMLGASLASSAIAQTTRHSGGKAQSVIFLNMAGGMSHIDTFDTKPSAKEQQGPTKTIGTNVDGLTISSYLPKTAKIMDKLCVINSMTSTQGAHPQGQYMMHKSYAQRGTIVHPSMGSWVLKLGGRLNKSIPGYISISTNHSSSSGGFFGATYSGVPIGVPSRGLQNVKRHGTVSSESFDARLSLAAKLNAEFHAQYGQEQVKSYDGLYDEAAKLMKSKDLKAFDIRSEKENIRNGYGRNNFGQGCLLARRLVQHQVRYVEVTLGGWDTHYDNFKRTESKTKILDQAYSMLIADLERNGLLDTTLVVLNTEFGRSPDIEEKHSMGRDHHPAAFSCVLAGGGIKQGHRYGKTDRAARRVRENPVTHQNINATIGYALGLDLNQVMKSESKRPFWMADKAKPITDIFA